MRRLWLLAFLVAVLTVVVVGSASAGFLPGYKEIKTNNGKVTISVHTAQSLDTMVGGWDACGWLPTCSFINVTFWAVNNDFKNPGRPLKMMIGNFNCQSPAGQPQNATMLAQSDNGMALNAWVHLVNPGYIGLWVGIGAKIRGERDYWDVIPIPVVQASIDQWIDNPGTGGVLTVGGNSAATMPGTQPQGVIMNQPAGDPPGDPPSNAPVSTPANTPLPASVLHSTTVNVTGEKLTVRMVNPDGSPFSGTGTVSMTATGSPYGTIVYSVQNGYHVVNGKPAATKFSGSFPANCRQFKTIRIETTGLTYMGPNPLYNDTITLIGGR